NVLIAGGASVFSEQDDYPALRDAELYTAPVSPWQVKELEQTLVSAPAATRLDDGQVLLSGFSSDSGQSLLFDPQNNSVQPSTRMLEPRTTHDTVLLPDGRVLAAAGQVDKKALNTTEIFDPSSSKWIAGPNLPGPIGHPKLVRLADGRIIAASLDATPAPSVKSLLLLDPKSMQWSTLQITIPDQQIMDLIATDTAHVVLLGRESEAAPPLLTTIHLEAKTISLFTPTDLYPTGSGALMPLLDGHVVVTSYISKSRIGIFDPVQLSWDFLGHADFTPPMARLVGGQVLWAGSQAATPKAGLFDPTTREVLQVERPIAKMLTTATIATPLLDGRVLVTASVQDSNATMLLYGKQNGTACKAAGECMSGHCVDGYCCDTACNDSGACQTCSVGRGATTNGTCATLLQCAPNQCKEIVPTPNTQTAACTSACVRASDCAEGYVCNINGACVAPANYDIPFTCAWAGEGSSRAQSAAAGCLAVVVAFFGRRRRRLTSADKPVTTGRKSDNFFS
ncbi:MAG TPA: kelch repeat-containing protein, partial [Polyangium sp.]|nr:kelch repeat-containing protein [Polyangium sp.]